jgi:hypothetical protein
MGLDDSFQGIVMVTGLEKLILSIDVVAKNFGVLFLKKTIFTYHLSLHKSLFILFDFLIMFFYDQKMN